MRADVSRGPRSPQGEAGIDLLRAAGRKVLIGTVCVAVSSALAYVSCTSTHVSVARADMDIASGHDGQREEDPDGEQAREQDTNQTEEERLVAAITSTSSQGANTMVADGGTYRGAVHVLLGEPMLVDWDKTGLLLAGDGSDAEELELRPQQDEMGDEAPTLWEELVFEVPDGRYARLCVVVSVAGEDRCEATEFADITFDSVAPEVNLIQGNREVPNGALLSSGDHLCLRLREQNPQREADGTVRMHALLREVNQGEESLLDSWEAGGFATFEVALRDNGALPDGAYCVVVQGADLAGNILEEMTWDFVVDSEKPRISVDVESSEETGQRGQMLYYSQSLPVRIDLCDAHLDLEGTLVAGTPVSELLAEGDVADESIRCDTCEIGYDAERGIVCHVELVLDEGTHEVSDLVRARDELGHASDATLVRQSKAIRTLVVDSHAPSIKATLSQAPSRVWTDPDTEREIAFFNDDAEILFDFSDESEIRSVELVGGTYAHENLEVVDGKRRAVIRLDANPLDGDSCVVVEDWAGNRATWSLGAGTSDPLTVAGTQELVGLSGRPQELVEDVEVPKVSMAPVAQSPVTAQPCTVRVRVADRNLSYGMRLDPSQAVLKVTKNGRPVSALVVSQGQMTDVFSCDLTLSLAARDTHVDDGRYVVSAAYVDPAGNASAAVEQSFVLDTTPPILDVQFDEREQVGASGTYFASERVAHLSLVEENVSAGELNGAHAPVRVLVRARGGRTSSDVTVDPWEYDEVHRRFVARVVFPVDGSYSLTVTGADKASNALVGTERTSVQEGTYDSGVFVTDSQRPAVSVAYARATPRPTTYGGVDYFNTAVSMEVTVADRALDVANSWTTTTHDTVVVPAWKTGEQDSRGIAISATTLTFVEGSGEKHLVVRAVDLAGNETTYEAAPFVVDQTAPVVGRVSVNHEPFFEGTDASGDPWWFFGRQDGMSTTLSFEVFDEHALDQAWIHDPDGAYEMRADDLRGKQRGTLALALKDPVAHDEQYDGVFGRDITLYVRDLAGNVRAWTLDRQGVVVAEHATDDVNVSILGRGVHPQALISDITSPVARIEGVSAGAYYRSEQVARIELNEYNFAHLVSFDPRRTVATVSFTEGKAEGKSSSWAVAANAFVGERPLYYCDQRLAQDGHYNIVVQVQDLAGNRSAVLATGEFTIDMTPPHVAVAWDNDDVRNERYYRAARVATITVTEHNFDPRLFQIDTTGIVGVWETEGDEHTCHVSFVADASLEAPHRLVVRGSDLAGNESNAYESPEFCIDTHAPTVSFQRRASVDDKFSAYGDAEELLEGTAYAQALEPAVVFEDDARLDPEACSVSFEGRRSPGAAPAWLKEQRMQTDSKLCVEWANLGLVQADDGPTYQLDADDVYVVAAKAVDLAGNESDECSVSFSVNRYGSNYFVEELGGTDVSHGGDASLVPLADPPRIVVHEINVCGAASELGEAAHVVSKEHAATTTMLPRTSLEQPYGYTLLSSTEAGANNPYEGWSEYVYVIGAGNFGRGSDSDVGDGGQGTYRVSVGSRDKAGNVNTSARFWGSDSVREASPQDKVATVSFVLDELGPTVEELDAPSGFVVGRSYEASFRLRDDITNGDRITVLVDGEEVPVRRMGSGDAIRPTDEVTHQGIFTFTIPAKPVGATRSLEIAVSDYTGIESRRVSVRREGFCVTTLVPEAICMLALVALVPLCRGLVRGVKRVVGKEGARGALR